MTRIVEARLWRKEAGALLAALGLAACTPEPSGAPARPDEPARAAPAPPTPPAAPVQPSVPTAFTGEWNMDLAACGTGLHDSRLIVREREIRFYESGGPVTAVQPLDPRRVQVEILLSGEGETWKDRRTFELSPDGSTLTDTTTADPLVRRRCPTTP